MIRIHIPITVKHQHRLYPQGASTTYNSPCIGLHRYTFWRNPIFPKKLSFHKCASQCIAVHRRCIAVHRRCIGVHRVVSSLLSLFKIFTKKFTTKHFHPLHRNASPCIGPASDAHRSASVWIKHSHYGITSIYWFFKNFFHVFLHLCIVVYLHDPYPYPYHS